MFYSATTRIETAELHRTYRQLHRSTVTQRKRFDERI